jgi:hypothetical protein
MVSKSPSNFSHIDKFGAIDQLQDNTGSCMAVKGTIANGAPVNVQPCSVNFAQRSWVAVNGGSNTGAGPTTAIKIGAESCLDVVDGKDASE